MVISENLIYMQVLVLYQSILILRTIHSGRHRKVVIKFRALSRIPTSIIYKRFLGTTCTQNSNYFSLCDESRKLIPRSHTKFKFRGKKESEKGHRRLDQGSGADPEIFQRGGGLRRKFLKEKCLLIHVSTRVYIKTRQTCNYFSHLPFQEDCLLFFALFFNSLYF